MDVACGCSHKHGRNPSGSPARGSATDGGGATTEHDQPSYAAGEIVCWASWPGREVEKEKEEEEDERVNGDGDDIMSFLFKRSSYRDAHQLSCKLCIVTPDHLCLESFAQAQTKAPRVSLTERLRAQRAALKEEQQRATERARQRSELEAVSTTGTSRSSPPQAAPAPSQPHNPDRHADEDDKEDDEDRAQAHASHRVRSDASIRMDEHVSRTVARSPPLPRPSVNTSGTANRGNHDNDENDGDADDDDDNDDDRDPHQWRPTESRETYVVDTDADSVMQRTAGTTRGSRGSRGPSSLPPSAAATRIAEDIEEDATDDAAARRRAIDKPTPRDTKAGSSKTATSPPHEPKPKTSSEGRYSLPVRSTTTAAETSITAEALTTRGGGKSGPARKPRPVSHPKDDASAAAPAAETTAADVEAALRNVVHEALSSEDVQSKIRECTMRVIREGKLAGLEHEDQVRADIA